MEKRSIIHRDSKLKINDEPAYVTLVLLKNVTLKTIGKVTGIEYIFNGAGSKVNVDERDVEFMLSRMRKSCCSGSVASPYFEVVR